MRSATYVLIIVLLFAHPNWVCATGTAKKVFSPDGSRSVVMGDYGALSLQDAASGKTIAILRKPWRIPCSSKTQRCLLNVSIGSFSPDGTLLATWNSGTRIALRNPRNGRRLVSLKGAQIRGHHEPLRLKFSPDSKLLVAITRKPGDKRNNSTIITVWDIATHKELLHVAPSQYREFQQITLSPDHKTIMAFVEEMGNRTQLIKLWDLKRGKELVTLKGVAASYTAKGTSLLFISPDFEEMVWDIDKGTMHFLDEKGKPVQRQSK